MALQMERLKRCEKFRACVDCDASAQGKKYPIRDWLISTHFSDCYKRDTNHCTDQIRGEETEDHITPTQPAQS